jgi:hypothetical protein
MLYLGFTVEPNSDGAVYTCPKCQEKYRYGLNACPDRLAAELKAHVCSPPRRDWSEWAKGQLRLYKAKREKAEFKGLTQESIDARPSDWYRRSETTNARLARILEGR